MNSLADALRCMNNAEKSGEEAGPPQALLQGRHQVPHRDDEARLHRGVRSCRRPQIWQNRSEPDWKTQQMWSHLTKIRHWNWGYREVDQQPPSLQTVWICCPYHFRWHHGPRRGQKEASWRQNSGIFFLRLQQHGVSYCLPNKTELLFRSPS